MNRSRKWRGAASLLAALVVLGGCGTKKAGPGEVAIEVTDAGFVPEVAYVPKGQATTLVVTRKTDQTCATAMVFAANGESHELPLNRTVRIDLPADRADTMNYACPMNMIKGSIVAK